MLKIGFLLLFATFALLLSCDPHVGDGNTGNDFANEVPPLAETPLLTPTNTPMLISEDGAMIYHENCARCHGDKGEGAKKGIPLISGHALHHSFDEYIEQVNDGTEKKMPAFKDKLSPEEITAVVNHVRNVVQAGIERGAEHHEHH